MTEQKKDPKKILPAEQKKKERVKMTIEQIEKILQGRFVVAADKQYWEKRLEELKQKEQAARENEIHLRKMRKYDRL